MKIVTDAKAVRFDVHRAQIQCNELTLGAVCFKLENGDNFTVSAQAMKNLVEFAEHWGGALVEVSQRDERLIGKGIVQAEDFPK